MKRLLFLTVLFLLTLPLSAEEKKTDKPAKSDDAATARQQPVESPLVAAAKRTRRGTSKSIVITEETLKNSTGHVTSTTIVYTPAVPKDAPPPAEVVANEQRAKARAADEKKAAEAKAAGETKKAEMERRARLAEESEQGEDGYGTDVDPAQLEKDLAANAKKEQARNP